MALELQNDEQQRIVSDNLSIAASNRLAAGNLSTQESIERVQRDVGGGVDTFGTGKSLVKGFGVAKDVRSAGVGAYAAGEADRFTSTRGVTAMKDAYSASKGFTPGAVAGAEGAARRPDGPEADDFGNSLDLAPAIANAGALALVKEEVRPGGSPNTGGSVCATV